MTIFGLFFNDIYATTFSFIPYTIKQVQGSDRGHQVLQNTCDITISPTSKSNKDDKAEHPACTTFPLQLYDCIPWFLMNSLIFF